jgi:hypothetical protein
MDIQIRVNDRIITHANILNHGIEDQILNVSTAGGNVIFYSPSYWQAFAVDPKGPDPL